MLAGGTYPLANDWFCYKNLRNMALFRMKHSGIQATIFHGGI
jgi:hypothetical protein